MLSHRTLTVRITISGEQQELEQKLEQAQELELQELARELEQELEQAQELELQELARELEQELERAQKEQKPKTVFLDLETSLALSRREFQKLTSLITRKTGYCFCGSEIRRICTNPNHGWVVVCSRTTKNMIQCQTN
jgi:thioesterase domain-containing protein